MPIINMVYKKKKEKYKTFTISWTEQSNMSSGWTYSDDAAWLTAGSTAFDEFFWYSAVRLNSAWVETAEVKQATPWQLNLSQLWTLTSGDNVMIKFPRLWIKMSKSGSVVTLSITDNPNAEADGFQYYAHSRWTLSSPVKKDALYLWAFKACNSSNVLKSWSWQSPVVTITQQNCINYARANDGNTGSAGYDMIGFYQREFINALYMMKYWNPDSQSVIWRWYTGWSAKVNTGWTVSPQPVPFGLYFKISSSLFPAISSSKGSHPIYRTRKLPSSLSIFANFGAVIWWSRYQIHWHDVITSNDASGWSRSFASQV